jgi:hypothetical protein
VRHDAALEKPLVARQENLFFAIGKLGQCRVVRVGTIGCIETDETQKVPGPWSGPFRTSPLRSSSSMHRTRAKRRWVQKVTTVSTAPPTGTFTRSAREIARIMARPDVSPKGLGSGIRMIQYFINRAGTHLTPRRRKELERAKRILQRKRAARKSGIRRERCP